MHPPRKLFALAEKLAALPPPERRFFARAWLLGPVVVAFLRARGLQRALELLAKRRFAPRGTCVEVDAGERLVRAAFRYGLGRHAAATSGTCLPESIVQYTLHLDTGPTPRLVIGVRKTASSEGNELRAHAWVERDDGPRREADFAPIVELSPRGLVGSVSSELR